MHRIGPVILIQLGSKRCDSWPDGRHAGGKSMAQHTCDIDFPTQAGRIYNLRSPGFLGLLIRISSCHNITVAIATLRRTRGRYTLANITRALHS